MSSLSARMVGWHRGTAWTILEKEVESLVTGMRQKCSRVSRSADYLLTEMTGARIGSGINEAGGKAPVWRQENCLKRLVPGERWFF